MVRYLFDPAQSRFTVQAFATGWLSGFGHSPTFAIRNFTGELRFTPEARAENCLSLTVQANSLSLTDRVGDRDRSDIEGQMRTDVLEVAAFPQVVFESKQIAADRVADKWYRLRIQGELQLHGVSKPLPLEAQLRMNGGEMHLSGQCSLAMSAFRIKAVSALAGMIKLKDELKFDFDILGRKQTA
jgi:polyisoprenoid-binding protein YceI